MTSRRSLKKTDTQIYTKTTNRTPSNTFFFLFQGISLPIFKARSLCSRFSLGVWSKSCVSFWTEKNTLSCHQIDSIHFRGATLYLLFYPLFIHQSTHSLLLFSFPKHQNSHKKGASQSPASTPKIKCIFFAFSLTYWQVLAVWCSTFAADFLFRIKNTQTIISKKCKLWQTRLYCTNQMSKCLWR